MYFTFIYHKFFSYKSYFSHFVCLLQKLDPQLVFSSSIFELIKASWVISMFQLAHLG